jgi:hypothetical protein
LQNPDKPCEELNISVTLRILKLLVKHAVELKEELQNPLLQTPTQPWKSIIPQLFSRLNHPENYVRMSISDLLSRIALDFPHLIVYPAVVGSQDGPTKIEKVHHHTNASEKSQSKLVDMGGQQRKSQQNANSEPIGGTAINADDENNEYGEDKADVENAGDEVAAINQDDQYGNDGADDQLRYEGAIGASEDDNQGSQDNDENENGDEDDDDDENQENEMLNEEEKVELKNSYKLLLNTLHQTNASMIDEVKLFVNEMRRITLLREELWLGTLNQIHGDVNKRLEQLINELTRTNANQTLGVDERNRVNREKYEILMQPIVSILEHVHEMTFELTTDQTPNEEQFRLELGDKVQQALSEFKDAENNAQKPTNGWSLFKQLHQIFHQRAQRRYSSTLNLQQISPKLASIRASHIPMPGKDGQQCTIQSISSLVTVLPTKTKPKKLVFIGSNGKRYMHLFKGLEDLHLDERIMQLLSIVNAMFAKMNKCELVDYRAVHYTVTPLGPRSGLISWVEGATPLFTLYKRYQLREAAYLASKQAPQQQPTHPSNQQNQQHHVMKPNEIYYNKLNPLLKEKGIKNFQENRGTCPQSILRQVLDELIKETPNDLLSKELWCHASTPSNW